MSWADPVQLPLWLAVLLAFLAAWALLDRLLIPSVRWFFRRRIDRVFDRLNTRLHLRIQPFKLTRRDVLIERLLYDTRVQEAARAFAAEQGMPRNVVMARVERYAREIVPAFNAYLYYRVGYWLGRKIVQSLYRVRLGYADRAGLGAIPPTSAIVFVMNHRSNMDYILVAYLAAARTALSYAVGEWARIWPLHTLLRAMGAFFVRRGSGNPLYRRILASYIDMATKEGVTQAVFLEGRLSRDGRLGEARLGILDYIVREFDPQGERDVVFIPTGVNFDRVLEDRTLLLDLDPAAPRRRGLGAAMTTLRFVAKNLRLRLQGRWFRFGYACANFGSPLSLRSFLARAGVDPRKLTKEERFQLVGRLGQELMAAIAELVPVLPVPLVAAALLRNPDRPLSELEVKGEVHNLVRRLEAVGAHVYLPRRDGDYAVTVGLRMLKLRKLLLERDGLFAVPAAQRAVVDYYAHSIDHLLQAAAARGLAAAARRDV